MVDERYIAEYSMRSFFEGLGKRVKDKAKKDIATVKRVAGNTGKKVTGAVRETSKTVGEATGKYVADNVTNPLTEGATKGFIKKSLRNPVGIATLGALGLSTVGGTYAGYRGVKGAYNVLRPKSKAEKRRKAINKKIDYVLNKYSQMYNSDMVAEFKNKKRQKERLKQYAIAGGSGVTGLGVLGAGVRYGGREFAYQRAKSNLRNDVSDSLSSIVESARKTRNPKAILQMIGKEVKDVSGKSVKNVKTIAKGGGKQLFFNDIGKIKKLLVK